MADRRTGYYVASRDWPPVGNDIPLADIYRALEAITQADVDAALRSLRHPVQEEPMPDTTESTDRVAAYLAEIQRSDTAGIKGHPWVESVPRLVAAVERILADHTDDPVFASAGECGHPEPWGQRLGGARPPEWDAWSDKHPLGAGDVGRICLWTEIGRYCPACTQLAYDDDPIGDSYVDASNCIVRPFISRDLLGEDSDSG